MRMQIVLRGALGALLLAGAAPLAAQAPAAAPDYLLAAEGIEAAPPPGFPAFERFRDERSTSAARVYRSRLGERMILVFLLDPFSSWSEGEQDVEGRRRILGVMARGARDAPYPAPVMREDSAFLVAEVRRVEVDGRPAIDRWYMPRTGAPRMARVTVLDTLGASDPAADPAIAAFLDAARPRPDGGPPVLLAFDGAGVEMRLAEGLMVPVRRSADQGVQMFTSRSGSCVLLVMVVEEPGGARRSPEQRTRHLHGWMRDVLSRYGPHIEQPARTAGGLAFHDVRFSRAGQEGEPVPGRGRIYTTLSGPHRMVAVMYFEDGAAELADEAAIVEMLDTLRIAAAPAGR